MEKTHRSTRMPRRGGGQTAGLLVVLVVLVGLGGMLCGAEGRAEAPGKPNILYINADDLGVMDVGFMGDTRYRTPNLDRLASEGMVFSNGYAPAANCAPSRAACLSGQAAPRTGVYTVGTSERGESKTRELIPIKNTVHLADEMVTVADELKACGYVTCQVGKWHVGNDPTRQGIDINVAGLHWGAPKSYFSPYGNPHLTDGAEGEYLTDRLTDEAIGFIGAHKERPFFLYFPYYTVHTPLQGRQDLVANYQGQKGVDVNYAAMIEALDENVGRLLDFLDASGLSSNTLVLFSSDNGGIRHISSQEPHRAGKGSYYEGGIRVPLTARWPGRIEAGSSCEVPVTGLDFYPTLVEVAGGSVAEGKVIDGSSLVPLLTGSGSLAERALFWHFPIYLQKYATDDDARDPLFRTRPGSAMRLGRWKLHEYFEDGGMELYDLEKDPGERTNLAQTMPEQVEELKKKLDAWRAEILAPIPDTRNPDFDPAYVPSGKKSKKAGQKTK